RAGRSVITGADGRAVDCCKVIAATGASGGAALTKFPHLTGPPCNAAPPLPRPLKDVPGGISAAPAAPAGAATPARRAAPSVLRLSISRRLSVRDVRARGLRLRFTV